MTAAPLLDVLIPTFRRPAALAATLTSLTAQTLPGLRVVRLQGCVLYDVAKLRDVGGFSFWQDLPAEHCGEDVLAQLRVLQRYGGCGVLPSGAYHQQLPTTVEGPQLRCAEGAERRCPGDAYADHDHDQRADAMSDGNQTPNMPDLSETELREMKVDELREVAKEEGVGGDA